MKKVDAAGNATTADRTRPAYVTAAQFAALVPNDGDECYFIADATAGVIWHFRYNGGGSTFKWECLGGPPITAEVLTQESTSSASYVALTTAMSATVPRAGDYDVTIGAMIQDSGNIGGWMSYDIGATAAVDNDSVQVQAPSSTGAASTSRPRRKTGLAASTALTAKCKTTSTSFFSMRWMTVTPVRIS